MRVGFSFFSNVGGFVSMPSSRCGDLEWGCVFKAR